MRRSTLIALSIMLLLVLVLSGCSQQNASDVQSDETKAVYNGEEGRISVYISGPEGMVKELETKFEEERGDVLEVFRTGCGPLRQKVWTEMEAGSIQADVIWGAEPIMYIALEEKDKLLQYESPAKEALLDEYKIGDGYFTLVNARYGVILYNKDRVDVSEAPSSWVDLMDEGWNGRLAMADATQSAMALALTAGIYQIQDNTWDYHETLKKNEIMLTKQNIEAVSKVETGEVDVGIAPHDGVLRLQKKAKKQKIESPLVIVWPEEGAISCQRPIAIIKNSARPEANDKLAKEFVDFALSTGAQKIATKYGFITVRNDLELPQGVPASVKAVTVDWGFASVHEEELREGFKNIMFDK